MSELSIDKAKVVASAYRYYSDILNAINILKSTKDNDSFVNVGIGENYHSYQHKLQIPRDLFDRMLAHALARAKANIDWICLGPFK